MYIYIIDLEAEFYFQSGVSTRDCILLCRVSSYFKISCLPPTDQPAHLNIYIQRCSSCQFAECREGRTRGKHRKTGHGTFSSSLASPLSRLYFTFTRWSGRGSGVSSIALNVLSTPLISPRHSRFSLMRRLCTRCTRITLNVAQQWHTCGQRIIAGILLCCVCV